MIEADVYRFLHQNGPLPGSAFGYRSKEEEALWKARDPFDQLAAHMQQRHLIDAAGVETLERVRQECSRPGLP